MFNYFLLFFICVFAASDAIILTRCQLATQLYRYHAIPKNQLAHWVCLAEAESVLNTAAISSTAANGHKNYGLFQINSYNWCSGGPKSFYNQCNVKCAALINTNLNDDIKCAKFIYSKQGFNAWTGWKNQCRGKNISKYIAGCKL